MPGWGSGDRGSTPRTPTPIRPASRRGFANNDGYSRRPVPGAAFLLDGTRPMPVAKKVGSIIDNEKNVPSLRKEVSIVCGVAGFKGSDEKAALKVAAILAEEQNRGQGSAGIAIHLCGGGDEIDVITKRGTVQDLRMRYDLREDRKS